MKTIFSTALAVLGALTFATTSVEAQLQTTAGLTVFSPYQGMKVYQGGYMSVSFSLLNNKPVGGSTVTMARKDGSNNKTLYTVADTVSLYRFLESYPVPIDTEVGDWKVNIITKMGTGTPKATNVVPPPLNRTTSSAPTPVAPTQAAAGLAWDNGGFVILAPSPTDGAPAPSGTPSTPGEPSVYYHSVDVTVVSAKDKPQPKSSALTLHQSAGQIAWKAACALGCVALMAMTL